MDTLDFAGLALKGAVLLAVNSRYDDNNGSQEQAIVWNGVTVFEFVNNGYATEWQAGVMPHASEAQKIAASAYIESITKEGNAYNKHYYNGRGAFTYVGCTVILKRSRKAPNNTPLEVIDFSESYYDSRYNKEVTEKVAVMVEGEKVWVSSSCIDQVVKGVKKLPFWCI